MSKIHDKLKWATIIKRLNEKKGFEMFRMDHSVIYKYSSPDKFGRQDYRFCFSLNNSKKIFIDENNY